VVEVIATPPRTELERSPTFAAAQRVLAEGSRMLGDPAGGAAARPAA
jgi:hypothetical protein